ncbi:hypothetical protein NQ314_007001, partial [Rhamnusium bicolor]
MCIFCKFTPIFCTGSGGSVVANRLTENARWSVLLLEAGRDENFFTDVPLMASLHSSSSYNWGYKSERLNTSCLGLIDGKCNMVRGKALGGTSVINFLLYTRGNRLESRFHRWSYKDVLPYFIKSENCTLCEDIDQAYHGKSGYMNIEHPGFESPMVKLFLKAGQDLGYKNNDPNGKFGLGVGPRELLEKVKIPVIQNLRVGYNLQDHMAMSTLAFLVNESVTVSDLSVQNPIHIYNYLVEGKGPYTIPGGAEALAFIKTKYSPKANDDYPDMELVLGAGALNGDVHGSFRNLLGIPDSLFRKVYMPIMEKPAFGIATVLLRPKSRGRVLIKDSNPLHWPILKPNYFEIEEDLATMVEGIKTV